MPNPPRSYDEILRRTVLDPDGAFRPTIHQVRAAYAGALTAYEQGLLERVHDALLEARFDVAHLQIAVEHDWVVLRGPIVLPHEAKQILQIVQGVPGVRGVTDLMDVTHQPDPGFG